MRQRWILIAILVAAVASFSALAAVPDIGARAGIDWTPSLFGFVLLLLAATGVRLAWGISFVGSVILAGWLLTSALVNAEVPERWAFAGVAAVVALDLWALRPVEPLPPPNQG